MTQTTPQSNKINNTMRIVSAISICALVIATAASFGADEPLANEGKRGLYAKSIAQVLRLKEEQVDLATAALIVSEKWSDIVYGRRYLSKLDDMAFKIRGELKARRLAANYEAIPVMNKYLFDELGFMSVKEARDPNDLFLHSVLDKRRGYCLSLSILYLSLGERLGLPLYGVVVPGHFFVRYDDGHNVFNIETTSGGGRAPNEHYTKEFKVPTGKRKSLYMKNLNKIETLGCFFNNLGNIYSETGNTEDALTALERAVEINPSLAESHVNLGNVYLKIGQVKDAIYEYREALKINPADAKAHLNLGNAYGEQNLWKKATAEYQHSLRLDPNSAEVYKNLAVAYCKREMFRPAISQLKQAIARYPRDGSLCSQLGDAYSQKGDYERAMSQYRKALKMKPDLAQAHYGIGMCYNKLDRVDDEIQAYRRALVIDPNMLGSLVNLGSAYFKKEEYDAAIEQYTKAVQIEPDDATLHYNLGAAYSNKGEYQQAVIEYRKAIAIEPEMADAHNGFAYTFYRLEKYDLAFKHIRIAEDLGAEIDKELLAAIKKKLRQK